jgi:hypothetical protein
VGLEVEVGAVERSLVDNGRVGVMFTCMDTLTAFAMGRATAGRELMVFDWEKAARLIVERKPEVASAGLCSDWKWTGGEIWRDGVPVTDSYTYLASTWAVPELDLDGDVVECFRMESECPTWNSDTKWPESALAIVRGEEPCASR